MSDSIVQDNIQQEKPKPRQKRKDDFNLGNILGQGAFGQVIEVEDKETGNHYAMKILSKVHIMKEKKMNYVKIERDVMTKLSHPNIVRLFLTFQDPGNLFYVVELAKNGDLQKALNRFHSIDISCSKILLGQILLAIAHMHQNKILHRDLKPENILLDSNNRVKITDFGTAKIFGPDEPFFVQRGSFVGSADYVSPETLNETPVGPSSDLWSFGCMIYSLFVGQGPFHTESSYATFQKIETNNFEIPEFVPIEAKDLIIKLLKLQPEERLGHNDYLTNYKSIREHSFFEGIEWDTLPKLSCPTLNSFQPSEEYYQTKLKNQQFLKENKIIEEEIKIINNIQPKIENNNTIKSEMEHFLLANEKILFEGNVIKSVFLSSKERKFVLTDRPRLFYVDIKNNLVKGSIPLCKELKVNILKDNKWEIIVPGRTYNLRSEKSIMEGFINSINNLIQQL